MPDTLSDFLLARIVEDERGAQADYVTVQAGLGLLHYLRRDPSVFATVQGQQMRQAQRTVAECEAKRRIVAMGDGSADFHQGVLARDGYQPFHTPSIDVLTRVQQLLALPYADHPDYRAEWSPDA